MEKIIEIPDGYEARIEGNKVVFELKESEDERLRSVTEKILKGVAAKVFTYEGVEKKDVLIWLEKQKEQKPAEWSEENLERAIKDWLYDNDCRGWDKYGNIYVSLRDLLKLVNHFAIPPHWKPSEEQMEWLEQAVRLSANKLRTHDVILSLYNDLKKLL